MSTQNTKRYGEWESPITPELMAHAAVRLVAVAIDGDDLYWLEGRPAEEGRVVLVRRTADGAVADVTPEPFCVRSRAHEYGGGAFLVTGGRVYFVNDIDQRIYTHACGQPPTPLTPEGPYRYADLIMDASRERLICVRESHTTAGEPGHELVAVRLSDGTVETLASGHDFYSSPVLNRERRLIAWLTWDHPFMPWDETELWVAEIAGDGRLTAKRKVAGGYGNSIFQPAWSPTGGLFFAADPRGWWNLYRWDGDRAWCVLKKEAEFGRPQWQFGMRTFGIDADGRLVTAYCEEGVWRLGLIDPSSQVLERLPFEHTDITSLAVSGRRALFIGSSPHRRSEVVLVNLDTGAAQVLRTSLDVKIDLDDISDPRPVEFPTSGGKTAHGFFYPPRNRRFRGPADELPPLIVMGHGGPTSATGTGFSLNVQYWTTRGFAVLDVNYRGSTGYGRSYREQLAGQWGVADVEDCVAGARYLASGGRVDPQRLIIRGSSAGGYTTLAALTFTDLFRAGASYYGVADLETLVQDTHKFESHYLDWLVGPYPKRRELYLERSPIHHVEKLSCPVIFFQGLEDRVVPPNQAESMVAALRAKGLPVAYLTFAGERHGFRHASTIRRTAEAELYFYGKVLGFVPAGEIEPVQIENL